MTRQNKQFIWVMLFVGWLFTMLVASYWIGNVTSMDRVCAERGGIVVRTPTNFSCIKVEVLQHS